MGTSGSSLGKQAAEEFRKQNYDAAIELYRKHLRRNRRDYNSWNSLAAAYYHTGLPRQGLRYLQSVQGKTGAKSYNLYYQGLCHTAVGEIELAKQRFTEASRYVDEYGSRATFEMAAIEYNARDTAKAQYWLSLYQGRYPQGVFIRTVQGMQQSLREGTFIAGIEGNKKPDMERALYRYNSLSLSERPHFWFVQLGGESAGGSAKSPTPDGKLVDDPFVAYDVLANAGIGVGPLRTENATAFAGYVYRQKWSTDESRVETYFQDPTDLAYQPFRPDVMEREHQLFGDFRRRIAGKFFVGAFGRMEFVRLGSGLIPGPDETQLNQVLKVAERTLLIPWAGISYLEDTQTLMYLYLRRELNLDAPDFSNKSYILTGGDEPALSYGLSHHMGFPNVGLDLNFEGFLYEFVYNDPWFDYTRLGGIGSIKFEFYKGIYAHGLFGMYSDTYQVKVLKQGSCTYRPQSTVGQESSQTPKACARIDDGKLFEVGAYWDYSQFHRFGASFTYVTNENPSLSIFDRTQYWIRGHVTMAFPSVDRVIRYVDRFADSAFTKEAE